MTLSSSARLDALVVNHYELQLRFICGNHVMEGPLSVDVQQDPGHIRCAGRFASPGEARGSKQGVGRHGLNRASLTSPLARWGNHSGAGNSLTWGPPVHSVAPRPGTPGCPGESSIGAMGGRMVGGAWGDQAQLLPGQVPPAEGSISIATQELTLSSFWAMPGQEEAQAGLCPVSAP